MSSNRLLSGRRSTCHPLDADRKRLRLAITGATAAGLAVVALFMSVIIQNGEGATWRDWILLVLFPGVAYAYIAAVLVVVVVVMNTLVHLQTNLRADLRSVRPVLRQRLRSTRRPSAR
jgi:hypothetical protein